RIGPDRAIQGNLDPTLLLGPLERVFAATDEVLARAGGRPGHIFNLGHGILPMTPVEHVQAVARYVHQQTHIGSRSVADDVVIIGAGIAGLAAAYELRQRHVPFLLLEATARPGGVILSEEIDGFTIDAGPDSLL